MYLAKLYSLYFVLNFNYNNINFQNSVMMGIFALLS